ncbi:EmrB/QacA subfamily drug resistance transporter [Agromyces sp. 3263]|uniref:MDR family MFS transporter n=1 Tax=Agromyces sp. 3263 TaxID=2817750 RepID=UPI00285EF211|nr:MDR family MFS transporter [Agromyces sp. 3263]MDR6907773.1 EmrB/QacA subfamily drug resistance transporter [Agromyces sp. 3263]
MSLSPLRFRLLIASLLTVSILGALDHTIVATSLATIAGELGALGQMGWVVVGYTLASTVLLPVLGKVGDLVGPRLVFLVSLVVFLVASLACGFAQDMTQLIVARVAQGMSSAGLQLMSQTIVAHVTTPRERPKVLSIIGAAFPVAILVGPVLGGAITDYWGWSWVFWINIPFGVAAFALAVFAIPHIDPGPRRRFDFAGATAFTVAFVALVLAVSWIGDPAAASAALVAFVVAAIGFAAFFVIELRVPEPIVPLRFFADRTIAAGVALSAIIGIGLFSVTAYLPTYFQMAYRTTATVSGLVPIATVFGMLVSNLATGWLVSRTGHYRVYPIVGTTLGAAGLLTMALLPEGGALWVPMVVMGIVGVGTGSFMSLVIAIVQGAVPRNETGTITATVNLVRQMGSTVATAVIGGVIGVGVAAGLPSILDASTLTPQAVRASSPAVQEQVAQLYGDVLSPVFAALAVVYALGIVAAVLLPKGQLSDEVETAPEAASESLTA